MRKPGLREGAAGASGIFSAMPAPAITVEELKGKRDRGESVTSRTSASRTNGRSAICPDSVKTRW